MACCIPCICCRPDFCISSPWIAARFVHELPPMVRFVLRPTGAMNRSGSNLVSYLLFEESFCRTLIDLGYQDTASREQEVREFFQDTEA